MIYLSILSDFRKNHFRKSPVFSEDAKAISVNFSDLGQTIKNLDSVGVDLDYVGPDISIREVKIEKKIKTLEGQIFNGGVL